jgi:hypothetical protein
MFPELYLPPPPPPPVDVIDPNTESVPELPAPAELQS